MTSRTRETMHKNLKKNGIRFSFFFSVFTNFSEWAEEEGSILNVLGRRSDVVSWCCT
jgi:hypothetical protein